MPTPPVLLANRLEPFGAAGQEFDEGLQVLDFGNRHRLHEVGDGGETTRFAVLAEDLKFAPRRRLECGGLIELELEGSREFHELLVLAAVGTFRVWFAVGSTICFSFGFVPASPDRGIATRASLFPDSARSTTILSSSEMVCLNEYRIIIDAPINHAFGADDRFPLEAILSIC